MSDYYDASRSGDYLPSECKDVLRNFHTAFSERDLPELQAVYENDFPKLTQKFFKASAWPQVGLVKDGVTKDDTFLALYKEVYYRHIFSKLVPTINDRFESFQNYISLFNFFLQLDPSEPKIDLPIVWLWDIIDEFTYQFRTFHEYRTTTNELDPEELRMLKDHVHVWSAQTVIRYLSAFVEKADHVRNQCRGKVKNIFSTLSDYSLVGLCQVMCLISDYTSSLEALAPLDFNSKNSSFSKVLGCRTHLYYYMGFSYLMLRRYRDAIDVFSTFLLSLDKMPVEEKDIDDRQKKPDYMRALLGIALSLCPTGIDDSLSQCVSEKLGEELIRMSNCDRGSFQNVFLSCCPRFISPYTPSFDSNSQSTPSSATDGQVQLLLEEISQREKFTDTYKTLRMCTSMGMDTLAQATNSNRQTLSTCLLNIKHKTRNKRHRSLAARSGKQNKYEAPIAGDWIGEPQLNFYISKDIVHVGESKQEKSFGDYFIRQSLKLEGIIENIDKQMDFQSI